MNNDLIAALQHLLKARAIAQAKKEHYELANAAYNEAKKTIKETEEKILEEMRANKLTIAAFPDGSTIQVNETPGSRDRIAVGIEEIRKYFTKNNHSLENFDKAIAEIKEAKKNETLPPVFSTNINFKGTVVLSEEDLKIKKLTKTNTLFYHEHAIQECNDLQVRFRYRAEDTSPIPNVIRREGKDGENADLVEGFVTSVWRSEDDNLCMRVRNRNYKTKEDLNLPPGNVYHGDKGEFPPLTYRVDRIVPGTLEVCKGNKWERIKTRD